MAEANSDIIAYLDDDAVPYENWLSGLLEPFRDPDVAVVTGQTLPDAFGDELAQIQVRFLSRKDPDWFEIANFGGLGIGANMALRKSSCAGWKVFDERLGRGAPFHGNEEHFAVACLLSRGYRAAHMPSAAVVHPSREADIEQEEAAAIAYWWLLFFEFPGHRVELLHFLFRRLRRKPLNWKRNPPGESRFLSSSLKTRLKASVGGTLLYFLARKPRKVTGELPVLSGSALEE
jgi:hypothetical protein